MLFIHQKFLVYKLETSRNCKEVKHIMIMIIAIISFFFIWWDIWLTVEKYFQIILSSPPLPEKIHFPLFTSLLPKKFRNCNAPPFCQIENFVGPPAERGEDTVNLKGLKGWLSLSSFRGQSSEHQELLGT